MKKQKRHLFIVYMILGSLALVVSFQNCSNVFWNLNNSKQTKANDINEMLLSSEKEIVRTKAELNKSMRREGGFEKQDRRLVVNKAVSVDTKRFNNEVEIKLKPSSKENSKIRNSR